MKQYAIVGLLISVFVLYTGYFLQDTIVFVDGQSIYYPVLTLLKTASLQMGDLYNTLYDSYYFKSVFSDTVFHTPDNTIYPMQPVSILLFFASYMAFFGPQAFFYCNLLLAVWTILFAYFILKTIVDSVRRNLLCLLSIAFLPTFVLYTVIPQNIIPAMFFLFASIFLLRKYDATKHTLFRIGSILFFLCACLIRIPMIFFAPLFLPYCLSLRRVWWGVMLTSVLAITVYMLNIKYFWDGSFIGYFHVNARPFMELHWNASQPVYDSWYTSIVTSLGILWNTIVDFFRWTSIVFAPLLVLSFLGISGVKKRSDRVFLATVVVVFLINLLYYSNMESQLWSDTRSDFSLSLTAVYYRYMMPSIAAMMLFIPFFLKRLGNYSLLISFACLVVLTVLRPMYYTGWASLQYFHEIEQKRYAYGKHLATTWYIASGSVILYDDRLPQYYLYPHVQEYHWFCYYCIPPAIRYEHTHSVVKKLLEDQKTIYFASFDYPYNTNSQAMEDYLQQHFIMEVVQWTAFPREKFIFYKIIGEKENSDTVS